MSPYIKRKKYHNGKKESAKEGFRSRRPTSKAHLGTQPSPNHSRKHSTETSVQKIPVRNVVKEAQAKLGCDIHIRRNCSTTLQSKRNSCNNSEHKQSDSSVKRNGTPGTTAVKLCDGTGQVMRRNMAERLRKAYIEKYNFSTENDNTAAHI